MLFFKIDIFPVLHEVFYPLSAIEKLFWNLRGRLRPPPWIRQGGAKVLPSPPVSAPGQYLKVSVAGFLYKLPSSKKEKLKFIHHYWYDSATSFTHKYEKKFVKLKIFLFFSKALQWDKLWLKRIEYILDRNLLEKSVKRPFCCTVSILQVYFTYLRYITFWALEHHFKINIERKPNYKIGWFHNWPMNILHRLYAFHFTNDDFPL